MAAGQVVFFTGLANKLTFANRLVRKKYREGERLAVYGPALLLNRLDQALWAEEPQGFLPHIRLRDQVLTPTQIAWTPLWLLEHPVPGLACDSAINLGVDGLHWLDGVARGAELIGQDDADRHAGRSRWKAYEQAGVAIRHHPQSPP